MGVKEVEALDRAAPAALAALQAQIDALAVEPLEALQGAQYLSGIITRWVRTVRSLQADIARDVADAQRMAAHLASTESGS